MSIIRNRELSQFGSFLYINDSSKSISITEGASGFVGIGSTIPTTKLDVYGGIKVTGVVTASSFYGNLVGTATSVLTIDPTLSWNTSGIVTASAFYIGNTPLVSAELQTWQIGAGNTIYKLNGNVGIGTSLPSQRLSVVGNISAGQFISTVTTGTQPLSVLSQTLVTNLNADYLRGKVPPSGTIVGTTDTQTLTNKTLTSPSLTSPVVTSGGIDVTGGVTLDGSTSGSTILQASATASGTLTLPAATDTLVGRNTTDTLTNKTIAAGSNTISGITNSNLSGSAAISNANLANSTISGVSLGSTLSSLTAGSYITYNTGTTYNGSSARTISVNASTTGSNNVVARDASGDFSAGTIDCSYLNATFDISADNANLNGDISANNANLNGNATADSYIVTGGTSDQFLKGDGSLDNNTYLSSGRAVAISLIFS